MHLIGQLIGLDFSASPHVAELLGDEARFRALAFDAGALYLRRLGETRPVVVVVLDDLHWADEGSLDFMRFVLQRDGDVPLLSADADAADGVRAARRLDARASRATPGST